MRHEHTSEHLPDALRHHRRQAGLSQEELAQKAGLCDLTVSLIETGKRPNVAIKTVESLARALQVGLLELLTKPAARRARAA